MTESSAEEAAAVETDLTIGPGALDAYARLSYTMWYALAEFVDNSTQSRFNYERLVDEVLMSEGKPLQVDIIYNKVSREMRIEDNSIGMNQETLIQALKVAVPTKDSKGRSKYGMGLKTAACWLGKKWQIVTCEWASGVELTAHVDVEAIAHRGAKVPITSRAVEKDAHYTKIIVTNLRRNIQDRTVETIKAYLGSMYMFDLKPPEGSSVPPLKLTYNTADIPPPSDSEWDTDPDGVPYRQDIPEGTKIGGKSIGGWVGVLKRGGRRYGGFSLFQNHRQIVGFPKAWKPTSIFGGVDDEGANNLVSQRLTGVLLLDGDFDVSHTKDAVLFDGDEEDLLEQYLVDLTKTYRNRATSRRGDRATNPWTSEKVRDLIESLRPEFVSSEMQDVINTAQLPPIDVIRSTNMQRVNEIEESDIVAEVPITDGLTIKVSVRQVSDYEPYVIITAGADPSVVHVAINGLHPYYQAIGDSREAGEECVTQFMYDAVAEYQAAKLIKTPVQPASVRILKDGLMRVRIHQNDNENFRVQREAVAALEQDISAGQ
jgi:hypothetical protein